MLFPIDYEDFVNNKCYCNSWVATAIVGAAVVGAASKSFAANQAASAQAAGASTASAQLKEAALRAQNFSEFYNNQARSDLQPYRDIGEAGWGQLQSQLPMLTNQIGIPQEMLDLQKPITLDQETLSKLPGYQFTKQQGLKATENSAAARGLGVSGAALKGAATFATGLASKTALDFGAQEMANRQSAYGRYATTTGMRMQQQGSAYDRLMALITTGADASKLTGVLDQKTGSDIAKSYIDAGKGVAGNTIGAANADAAATNATGNAIAEGANSIGGYMAYKGLYGAPPAGAPNMTFTKGVAGDQYVPTYG